MVPDVQQLMIEIKTEFPSFVVRRKDASVLMRAIDVFLKMVTFGRMTAFLTGFITTINNTVWVPSDWDRYDPRNQCEVLRHERVHMRQARALSFPLFALLYLFVFLPAGLAWFRAKFEMEAYEETIQARVDYGGADFVQSELTKEAMISLFMSSQYVWMWPFPKFLSRWYDQAVKKALNNQ